MQNQLRSPRRRPSGDDDANENEDDKLDARNINKRVGQMNKYKNKRNKKGTSRNVWRHAKILLQPTSNWGPAKRTIALNPSRTLTETPSPGNQIILFYFYNLSR